MERTEKDPNERCVEIIGIAGSIGAGKSVVSRILRCNGCHVYDCDREASSLMSKDSELRQQLKNILGERCYIREGTLDKRYVSSRIFCDSKVRDEVNRVVHKAVKNDFMRYISTKSGKVYVESAIMSTSGLDQLCDKIFIVDAPADIRMKRVMARNNLPEEEVRRRMKTQNNELASVDMKKVVVIENDDNSRVLEKVIHLAFPETDSISYEFYMQVDRDYPANDDIHIINKIENA